MEMISAGAMAEKDGCIGYEEPYATAHQARGDDDAFQQDVRSAATTIGRAARLQAEGRLIRADAGLKPAKPK